MFRSSAWTSLVSLSRETKADGANAYVASDFSNAFAIFDRDIPPQTTITKKPKSKIKTKKKSAKVKVSFTSEAGATFKCKLDNAAYKSCTSPYSVKAKSKGGKGKKHTISIQVTDTAGNVGKAATVEFKAIRKG